MGSREVCIHNKQVHDDGRCSCKICYPPDQDETIIVTLDLKKASAWLRGEEDDYVYEAINAAVERAGGSWEG